MLEFKVGDTIQLGNTAVEITDDHTIKGVCKYSEGYTADQAKLRFVYFINEATKTISEQHPEGCYDLTKLGEYNADALFVINFKSDSIPIILPKAQDYFVSVENNEEVILKNPAGDTLKSTNLATKPTEAEESFNKEKVSSSRPLKRSKPMSNLYSMKPLGKYQPHPSSFDASIRRPADSKNQSSVFSLSSAEVIKAALKITEQAEARLEKKATKKSLNFQVERMYAPADSVFSLTRFTSHPVPADAILRFKVTADKSHLKRQIPEGAKLALLKLFPTLDKLYGQITFIKHQLDAKGLESDAYYYSIGEFSEKELEILESMLLILHGDGRQKDYIEKSNALFKHLAEELQESRQQSVMNSNSRPTLFNPRKRERDSLTITESAQPSRETRRSPRPSTLD